MFCITLRFSKNSKYEKKGGRVRNNVTGMKEEMLKPEAMEKYFRWLWFIVWCRQKDKRICLEMEINGPANAVKADVEVVIRVKRHTRPLDGIQEHGRVVSKRESNDVTVVAQL